MAGILEDVGMTATILRVRDVAASVGWYRDVLGLEPLHVGADGEHPIASFAVGDAVVSLWQLPAGAARDRADNDANSYVVVVVEGDVEARRAELARRGVDVGEVRRSANFDFLWFHDPDDNRWEISCPRTAAFARVTEDVRARSANAGGVRRDRRPAR